MAEEWISFGFIRDEDERADEPMGSKEKWWVAFPADDRQWLLKLARLDDRDGTVSGEDWAEWCVHRLSRLIGVPTATVHAATLEGRRAIISRSIIRNPGEYLEHGNSVLSATFSGYDQSIHGENPGYTPAAVRSALTGLAPPVETAWPAGFTAFDAWVGYLVMDAWVAGRDRHHENWGTVIRGDDRRLAPSFDHGNALGFQERDDRRIRLVDDEGYMERWVRRGTSRHFAGRPDLVDLAFSGLALASRAAARHWVSRIEAIDEAAVRSVVDRVPAGIMSEVTRTFVTKLLATNRRRLLDGYSHS